MAARLKKQINTNAYVAFAVLGPAVGYGLFSWALNNGNIFVYIVSFLAFYYGIYFAIELIKHLWHVKTSKTGRAKKAH